jgi:hypothetical protein
MSPAEAIKAADVNEASNGPENVARWKACDHSKAQSQGATEWPDGRKFNRYYCRGCSLMALVEKK